MANIFQRSTFIIAAIAALALGGCAAGGSGGPDKVVYHINDSTNATALMDTMVISVHVAQYH